MKKESKAVRKASIEKLVETINNTGSILQLKKVTAGFDGFVDTIVRIIKEKKEGKSDKLFRTKKEFAKYILKKGESSFSLELEERNASIGGNMPIMANALANMGVRVNCIGTFGHPQTHPVFKNLSPGCKLYSFANPGFSTAYEFQDGKILLAQMGELNHLGWEEVKEMIGLDNLVSLYNESDLVCLVNWSEIGMSTDIWKGVLREVLPRCNSDVRQRIAFFDLADCSKRSKESIREVLEIIRDFGKFSKVILGLNRNESNGIYEALFDKKPKKEFSSMGKKIFQKLNADVLILHSSKEAFAIQSDGIFFIPSFFIKKPLISTGAGDNFNAGFCAGQLLKLDPVSSIILAHAASGSFVKNGRSPSLTEISSFLETQ